MGIHIKLSKGAKLKIATLYIDIGGEAKVKNIITIIWRFQCIFPKLYYFTKFQVEDNSLS